MDAKSIRKGITRLKHQTSIENSRLHSDILGIIRYVLLRLLISVTRRPLALQARSSRVLATILALLTSLFASVGVASDLTQHQSIAVSQVVVNILSYTRWPDPSENLRLCIVAPTEYADDLLAAPHQAGNRVITPLRRAADDPDLGLECDVVYIGVIDGVMRLRLSAALAGYPVLTISEQNTYCAAGAMFCLDVVADRVSFKVNLDAVARSGVKIHPAVLQLSRGKEAPR